MEINLGNAIPVFAHDMVMSTVTRARKNKAGKSVKETYTELVFIDIVRKTAIARIVLPLGVLEEVPRVIEENLKKIRKELRKKEMPKEQKIETKTRSSYFG
jgi:hypothetical protein